MKIKYLLLFLVLFLFPLVTNAETLFYNYQKISSKYDEDIFITKVKNSDYFQQYIKDYPNYMCYFYAPSIEYYCYFRTNSDLPSRSFIQSNNSGINFYEFSVSDSSVYTRKQFSYGVLSNSYVTSESSGSNVFSSRTIKILHYNFSSAKYLLYDSSLYIIDTNINLYSPISFKTEISGIEYSCVSGKANLFDIENTCSLGLNSNDYSNYNLAKDIVGKIPVEFEFLYSIFSVLIAIIKFLCILAPTILVIKLMRGGL